MRMTTVEALTASKNTLTAIQQMEDVMKASDKLLEGQDAPLMEAREVSIVMEMLRNRARRYQTVASAGMWGLSMREQCVLHSYYLCGKTIREIGEAFGLRERMVKQIKSDALAKLARKRGKRWRQRRSTPAIGAARNWKRRGKRSTSHGWVTYRHMW